MGYDAPPTSRYGGGQRRLIFVRDDIPLSRDAPRPPWPVYRQPGLQCVVTQPWPGHVPFDASLVYPERAARAQRSIKATMLAPGQAHQPLLHHSRRILHAGAAAAGRLCPPLRGCLPCAGLLCVAWSCSGVCTHKEISAENWAAPRISPDNKQHSFQYHRLLLRQSPRLRLRYPHQMGT